MADIKLKIEVKKTIMKNYDLSRFYVATKSHLRRKTNCNKKADTTMPAPHFSPIHISPLLHTNIVVFPDDDVIETRDADDVTRFDQPLRHFDVFPTRRRVLSRVNY